VTHPHPGSVLVADGDTLSALAIARSLGRRRIPVWVAASKWSALGAHSRYVRGRIHHASPETHPTDFVSATEDACKTGRADLVFPTTDVALRLVLQHSHRLPESSLACLPTAEAADVALDKARLLRVAESLAIPIPKTHHIESGDHVDQLADQLAYPIVLKARSSRVYIDGAWIAGAPLYAGDSDELRRAYSQICPLDDRPILQEYVPGQGCGVFALMNHGIVRALFSHRRVRENPPQGGVSVVCESCLPHPVARAGAISLLESLQWHGVAMVEFRIDSRDGIPKLMEVNGRFWGSLALAIEAGVDFPYLLYRMAQDGDVPTVTNYRLGIRSRWLLGELDRLRTVLLKPGPAHGVEWPTRRQALRSFLCSWHNGTRCAVERLDDPVPAMISAVGYGLGSGHLVMRRIWGGR